MIIWLLEFVFSIAVGAFVIYFFFLTSAPRSSGVLQPSSGASKKDKNDQETVSWLACIEHWCAAAALGGGCADPALWSSTLTHRLDTALSHIGGDRTGPSDPPGPSLRLETFTFGEPWATQPKRGKESMPRQTLPVVSCIRSHVAHSPHQVTRELTCTLHFVDTSFHLRLHCDTPLLGGLSKELSIPANLLSLKGIIDVRELVFETDVCLRLCGCRVEIFFPKAPHINSKILAFPSSSRRSSQVHLPMEVKAGELVRNSIRVALEALVFPQVLVLTVHRYAPRLRWSRERLDSSSQ